MASHSPQDACFSILRMVTSNESQQYPYVEVVLELLCIRW